MKIPTIVNNMKEILFSYVMGFLSLAFYLFFAFYDKAIICVYSPSYINMSFSREPVYPLLLAFFRLFFKDESIYLFFVILLQSILAALAGFFLADYIKRKFSIPNWYGLILYLIPLCVSLLCRFAAIRKSMYSNSILTEGITISLFLLYFRFLLEYMIEHTRSSFFICCILSALLIGTRKQMLITLPLLFLVFLLQVIFKDKKWISVCRCFFICIVILLSVSLLDRCYNFALRGEFKEHSSDNRFISTMLFYVAERTDASYISDKSVAELFLDIYDTCDINGYLAHSSGDGWLNEVSHFGDNYDHIQIDTMWPKIIDFSENNHPEMNQAQIDMETDKINSTIIYSLLPHKLPQLIKVLHNNFLSGLVTTVAQRTPSLIIYSITIYIIYFILYIRLAWLYFSKKKSTSQRKNPIVKYSLLLASLIIFSIVINVCMVSSVIFCQTRYTIYNMPLFYLGGAVLLYTNLFYWHHDKTILKFHF